MTATTETIKTAPVTTAEAAAIVEQVRTDNLTRWGVRDDRAARLAAASPVTRATSAYLTASDAIAEAIDGEKLIAEMVAADARRAEVRIALRDFADDCRSYESLIR